MSDHYLITVKNGVTHFRQPCNSIVKPGPERRGKVREFSKKSRNRLAIELFSLNESPDLFLTLTYPTYYPADSSAWKNDLHKFSKVLQYRFPGSWFYWRLEPQKRGAPHYHLLGSLGSQFNLKLFRKWLSHAWANAVGSGGETYKKHLLAGTNARVVKSSSAMLHFYVSKYLSKPSTADLPEWKTPGRFWGRIGQRNIPAIDRFMVMAPKREFFAIRRLCRRWMKSKNRSFGSRSTYHERLKFMESFFMYIPRVVIQRFIDHIFTPLNEWYYSTQSDTVYVTDHIDYTWAGT